MEIKLEKGNMVYTVQEHSDFHKELLAKDFKEAAKKEVKTKAKTKAEGTK